MSKSMWYDATAYYELNVENDYVKEGMKVGIEYDDISLWGNGPSFWVYNWETSSWDPYGENLGKPGNYVWRWKVTSDSNDYVNNDGDIRTKVYAEKKDDTILCRVGVRYQLPYADLDCIGSISWTDVAAGETVTGSFKVKNIGESNSKLNWEVDGYPDWGTWSFDPSSGSNLEPEDGAVTVDVTVTAPNEKNKEFTGEIMVVNKDDKDDFDTISVSLITPFNYQNHRQTKLLLGKILQGRLSDLS